MGGHWSDRQAAMEKLQKAAADHFAAVTELKDLGVLRSRTLVGDLGEQYAADFYGVQIDAEARRERHYDLIDRAGRRIEVKTLRSTPGNKRASIPPLLGDYDVLLAIRLREDYTAWYAIEVPREVVERNYPRGTRVSWTRKLESDPGTKLIPAEELLPGANGP